MFFSTKASFIKVLKCSYKICLSVYHQQQTGSVLALYTIVCVYRWRGRFRDGLETDGRCTGVMLRKYTKCLCIYVSTLDSESRHSKCTMYKRTILICKYDSSLGGVQFYANAEDTLINFERQISVMQAESHYLLPISWL